MRVLRGTLTFILGMIIGIILFVLAIGGAVYIIGTSMTVGELQQKFTDKDIVSPDSEAYDSTVLDAALKAYNDIQNLDNVTLETLYKNYGIKILNGINGVDFTQKDFYSMPIKSLFDDLSVVINSFTLDDVSILAKFELPDLPVIKDNLNVGMKDAINNIVGSIDGNLTLRDVQTKFGIDIGVGANKMMQAVQDVKLSAFGDTINAVRLSNMLDVDVDEFVKSGENDIYVKLGENGIFEQVSAEDLALKARYDVPMGVETYIAGSFDTDEDGKANRTVDREMRYILKTTTDEETGEEKSEYVVDNSCYEEDFDAENNETAYYRHVLYAKNDGTYNQESPEYYVVSYANRVFGYTDSTFSLVQRGFFPLSDLLTFKDGKVVSIASLVTADMQTITLNDFDYRYEKDGATYQERTARYYITDTPITDNSRLQKLQDGKVISGDYLIVHEGTSSKVLQLVAYMTVAELENSDDLLDTLTVADVVDTEADDTAKILKALSDAKLSELGPKVDTLTLAEMTDIKFDSYGYQNYFGGAYVLVEQKDADGNYIYVNFDSNNPNFEYFDRYSYNSETKEYYKDATGKYMRASYFTLYNPALHDGDSHQTPSTTYFVKTDTARGSSKVLQRLAYTKVKDFSSSFEGLTLGEVMDIDADIYKYDDSASEDVAKYYYDSIANVYLRVTKTNQSEHVSDDKYVVYKEGSAQSVLKRLAYVKIDDLSDAMDKVTKDMLLSELVDIYSEYAVEENTAFNLADYDETKHRFFIEDTDGDGYVFAYNSKGKYVKGSWRMDEYTALELEPLAVDNAGAYSYKQLTSVTEATAALASYNIYYKGTKDGATVYENNVALCTYIVAQSYSGGTLPAGTLYTRVEGTSGENPQTSVARYGNGTQNVYVLINGTYVRYDMYNLAHLSQSTYYKKVDATAGENLYVKQSQPGILQADGTLLLAQDAASAKFAKYKAENVYFKTTDTTNAYVYIGGKYVPYDESIHGTAEDNELFVARKGYVATIKETYLVNSADDPTPVAGTGLANTPVTLIREKSQAVLRMLADKETTVETINEAVSGATIKDIMDVEEDSLFSRFQDSTIENLSDNVETSLKEMSVGELLDYINIASVDPQVKSALKDVTLTNFFNSLKFTSAGIVVDMEIACGYKAKA